MAKKFEFSLDRLLNLKRRLEKLAVMEQARAQDAVARARAAADARRAELARVADHMAATVGRAMDPRQWASAATVSDHIGHAIRAAEEEVAAAERKLHAVTQERTKLATDVEALATLRKDRWDAWRAEVQKADEVRLSELTLRRWQADRDAATEPAEAP